jgi:tetratricopeptide (TPR) repeat protein
MSCAKASNCIPTTPGASAFSAKHSPASATTSGRGGVQQALALGDDDASARLALIGWIRNDEFGKQLYQNICLSLYDPSIEGSEARSLLWPSVLTNAFESDERYKPFLKELVRRAQESSAQEPSNLYRRNTLGAALYRAGNYEEAIKELEAARAANLAERANALSQYYDRMLRIPISRTPEGRPQDWAFLAMANARLNRRSEAQSWIENFATRRSLPGQFSSKHDCGPCQALALELLYDKAFDVVRKPSQLRRKLERACLRVPERPAAHESAGIDDLVGEFNFRRTRFRDLRRQAPRSALAAGRHSRSDPVLLQTASTR